MTTLAFELSMPSVGSWNGKWTGAGNYYAVFHNIGRGKSAAEKVQKLVEKGSFHYDFGDGWCARINVREVSGRALTVLRRRSQGFCGYEWMVSSILEYGEIRVDPPRL